MISVSEALLNILALGQQLESEQVELKNAVGRILTKAVVADRDQPPFLASVMDGYAIRSKDLEKGISSWHVIGESGAGHGFVDQVKTGETTRIFTGAPMPVGTDQVIIQENVKKNDQTITLINQSNSEKFVRAIGSDFSLGFTLDAPRRLTSRDVALMAAMNSPLVWVTKKPEVVIIGTGDELVQPGEIPNDDQIIASNTYGLAAMMQLVGANPRMLPIAKDRLSSLAQVFSLIGDADLVVTVGGASVGDYDLVSQATEDYGITKSFYKVLMRPGKPLMAGHLKDIPIIGLPGNPVSAMVCGEIFLVPLIKKMLGLPAEARFRNIAPIGHDLPKNGPREHYVRAKITEGTAYTNDLQDSSLLSVLVAADALVVRPKNDGPLPKGSNIEYISLNSFD
ncbi:MAG: molybdopterin molybdotransferase MoeA [Planktomarina sp.]|nr:molybdopterin molybdotransferase MoeA [Planktomarina sp.]